MATISSQRASAAVLVGLVAVAGLTGCGSSGARRAPAGPSAAVPVSTPASSAAPSAGSSAGSSALAVLAGLPKGPVPAALVGTYTYESSGTWHVTLRADGTYGQWNPQDELDIIGHFGVTGGVAVFQDERPDYAVGDPCPDPGAYTWHVAGKQLVMAVRKDDCTVGRIQQWTAGWTKTSTSVLRLTTPLSDAQRP